MRATFQACMVSGTPKIHAMQTTSALEGTTRGPYAGCVDYISFAVGRASTRAGSHSAFSHYGPPVSICTVASIGATSN